MPGIGFGSSKKSKEDNLIANVFAGSLAIACFVLVMIGYFTPYATASFDGGTGSCRIYEDTYFVARKYHCDGCGSNYPCPDDDGNWRSGDCAEGNTKCKQVLIYQVCQYFLIASMVLTGIGMILFAVRYFEKIDKVDYVLGVNGLAIVCLLVVVLAFSIGMPKMVEEDYITYRDGNADSCPDVDSNSPPRAFGGFWPFCNQFVLDTESGPLDTKWGPGVGWILTVVGTVCLLISNLLQGLLLK
eukprot:TRINITY_DN90_c0_g1_i1.p1 TRINITY_DN90_c0_g1~~TRINITY_DN90_c0_g1_i1.p1  ORF type:complete len:243 (-),score=32.58 TRINITY_DN90_c0_g1_i1:108-836(-)